MVDAGHCSNLCHLHERVGITELRIAEPMHECVCHHVHIAAAIVLDEFLPRTINVNHLGSIVRIDVHPLLVE